MRSFKETNLSLEKKCNENINLEDIVNIIEKPGFNKWNIISKTKIITNLNFTENYIQQLNWELISKNKFLNYNYEFFERFETRLNWDIVSRSILLNLKIVNKFYDRINFYNITFNKNLLNEELILRLIKTNNFKFNYTLENNIYKFNFAFVEKVKNFLNWYKISQNDYLTETFINNFQDKLNFDIISLKLKNPSDYSFEFFENFKNKLNWDVIQKNDVFFYDEKFFEKFLKNRINWNTISSTRKYITNKRFTRKYKDYLNWDNISYLNLSISFIREFKDEINWIICNQKSYSEEFITEFHNYITDDYKLKEDNFFSFEYLEKEKKFFINSYVSCSNYFYYNYPNKNAYVFYIEKLNKIKTLQYHIKTWLYNPVNGLMYLKTRDNFHIMKRVMENN